MSEQELNSILEEIKNRGNSQNPPKKPDNDEEINFEFNSFVSKSPEKLVEEPELTIEGDDFVPADDVEDNEFVVVEEETEEFVAADEVEDDKEVELTQTVEEAEETKSIDEIVEESEPKDVEPAPEPEEPKGDDGDKKKKGIIIGIIVAVLVVIIAVVAIVLAGGNKEDDGTSTTETVVTGLFEDETAPTKVENSKLINPLTGETDYNTAAIGKRPVAVVVENEYSTASVRPQWGLDEADIVLEGESEYSTRMLLFWADYTNMPKQIGPARSARPPFIRFSQLFDSVFIHAGLSHTKGNYTGADSVFKNENVDHINLLRESTSGTYFGRDTSRTTTLEHTGYLNGTNVPKLLEAKKINTSFEPSNYTQLAFNDKDEDLGDTKATNIDFNWTSAKAGGRCPKTGHFAYNEDNATYSTTDFDSSYGKSSAEWKNLVFLLDTTEYVVKENYKGSGSSETYCDYKLSGGTGKVASNGTIVDITWGVNGKKLWMKDSNGNEIKLNPGKTYIGYGSSNHGGSVIVNE